MQIRKLDKYVYDVFLGVGYDNHVRVQKYPWGIRVIQGQRLTKDESNAIVAAIERFPNGSVANV